MRGVAEATANIFFVKTAQDWQIRQDLECKVIMFILYGCCQNILYGTIIMRISFGKNIKEFRAAQEGRASPFGGLFVDNFPASFVKMYYA